MKLCDFVHYNVQYVMFIVAYIILKINNLTLNYHTSSKDINVQYVMFIVAYIILKVNNLILNYDTSSKEINFCFFNKKIHN
jgi:hypothetical protein